MSKPKGEKCDTCFVKNNRLRCSLCKWKTEEWFWNQPPAPITISGDEDLYVERKEKLQLSPETSTNDEEIIIKTGQTYGKSANISKDSICEQIKKHAERIKAEADKNPDSLWAKGMRSFDVLDDSTTSKTETVDTDLISRYAATSIPILPKEARKKFKDYDDAFETGWLEALECVNMLPPVDPPKKVVAQIKVDTEEIVERIKEEYEIKERPVCDDCISRETVMDVISNCEHICDVYGELKKLIENIPSVEPTNKAICEHFYKGYCSRFEDGCFWQCQKDPKRPKGKWIEYIDDMNGGRYGRCTSCNKSTLNAVSYDLKGQRHIMDFCPKCGADMRGEE